MTAITQRVVTLVMLTGSAAERQRFEDGCVRRGWAVLEQPPQDPDAGQHARKDVHYVVEMRIFGIAWRSAEAAKEQMDLTVRSLDLTARVLAAERLAAGDVPLALAWRTLDATTPPSRPQPGLWRRWTQTRNKPYRRRVWAVNEPDALRLARRRLPGTQQALPGIQVRSQSPTGLSPLASIRNWVLGALAVTGLFFTTYGTNVAFSGLHGGSGYARWGGSVLALAGCTVVCWAVRLPWSTAVGTQRSDALDASAFCLVAIAVGLVLPQEETTDARGVNWIGGVAITLKPAIPKLGLLVLVLGGLVFLIYSSGWRSLAPWLIPVLIPISIGFVPGAGGLVIRQYLDAFGTEPADVGMSLYWQMRASASWLGELGTLAVIPAALGYLRLFRLTIWPPSPAKITFAVVILFAGYVWYFNGHFLEHARRRGEQAVEAATNWHTPPPYYGITPTWVCATPLAGASPAGIPIVGGTFSPRRSYLMLGDSDGAVILWAPPSAVGEGAAETLRAPLSELRIRPIAAPERGCPSTAS